RHQALRRGRRSGRQGPSPRGARGDEDGAALRGAARRRRHRGPCARRRAGGRRDAPSRSGREGMMDPLGAVPSPVTIVEVGPRDGLQNESPRVSIADRVRLIEDLAAAGLKVIEAGAFVSPKWVPQMAATAEVLAAIERRPGVRYPVLVPNEKGLDAAL